MSKANVEVRRPIRPQKERGAIFPQIVLTVTMCIGSVSFGYILNWGEASLEHMKDLIYVEKKPNQDYAWLTSAAPAATAPGIFVWSFLTTRIGPRKTLLLQTPIMLLSWAIMYASKTYKWYYVAHFTAAFCASSYISAGEVYLLECVHRNNLKFFFALFRSAPLFGVLSMNFMSTFLSKTWICIVCANIQIICSALTASLPDAPSYLIIKSELEAETSLKYYLGKDTVGSELYIVRQHMYFLNFGSLSFKHMLTYKVVAKAIIIITLVLFFKTCTGYYAFILDSVRIFHSSSTIISPYGDNIIFGIVLFTSRFIGCFVHLYGNFGVKKPMLISMLLCTMVLFASAIVDLLHSELMENYEPMPGIDLLIFSLFAISYDIGMNTCPEITLYAYVPYQVYDVVDKIMKIMQWALIFGVARIYMFCKATSRVYITLWVLAIISLCGCIFIAICVVDTKGKSLMTIQMKLGGNPVGSRGSWRQRYANPFETLEDMYYLENLIAADLANSSNKSMSDPAPA